MARSQDSDLHTISFVRGGAAAAAESLLAIVRRIPPSAVWQVIGIGRANLELTAIGLAPVGDQPAERRPGSYSRCDQSRNRVRDHAVSRDDARSSRPPRSCMTVSRGVSFAAGLAGGVLVSQALRHERIQFVRLAGSSIATPGAAGWVTDFLNAAYYRRAADERQVDDLRLATSIVTTFWQRRGGRPLRARDVLPFHQSFGRGRFLEAGRSPRGTLSREQLLEGADGLLGSWFSAAYDDDRRRGWGVVFATGQERSAYEPEERLALAALGAITPGIAPGSAQTWHTYPPVQVPSAEGVISALTRTETWPDYASEIGRFTPLRRSELLGQTFEIEVAAGTAAGRPIFQRGYVTITRLVTPDDSAALERYFEELEEGLARYGRDEPRAVPEGGEPIVGFDLTTHEGHFMGRGNNRLILYRHDGATWVRAAGTWDPMPWHLEQIYRVAGRDAQHVFWGEYGLERQSMLHQLALRTAG
jgi:hypothetical protein